MNKSFFNHFKNISFEYDSNLLTIENRLRLMLYQLVFSKLAYVVMSQFSINFRMIIRFMFYYDRISTLVYVYSVIFCGFCTMKTFDVLGIPYPKVINKKKRNSIFFSGS